MKIIIVDNNSKFINRLVSIFKQYDYKVIRWDQLTSDTLRADTVVLPGSKNHSLRPKKSDLFIYTSEIRLLRDFNKLLLGVCAGFELLVKEYVGKIERSERRILGKRKIKVIKNDPLFESIFNPTAYEAHHFVVKDAGPELSALAASKYGIEAVKHKTKPYYGVQFHPDAWWTRTFGRHIINNFLTFAISYTQQS